MTAQIECARRGFEQGCGVVQTGFDLPAQHTAQR
jgi:hypothetical protein